MVYHTAQEVWQQSRFLAYFYCIRGLDLPFKTAIKQTAKSFTITDWFWWTWFIATNIVRVVSLLATYVYFLKVDKAELGISHLFVIIYETLLYPVTVIFIVGNVTSVLLKRQVLVRWMTEQAEDQIKDEVECYRSDSEFNDWKIYTTKASVVATYFFSSYYVYRAFEVKFGPLATYFIAQLTYMDLTYNVNMTPVTLMYLANSFEKLAAEVKDVTNNESMKTFHKKEKLARLFGDWIALKRLAEDVGNAAAPYLIPFLFWVICTSSLKILFFSDLARFKIDTTVGIWFQLASLFVRSFLVGLLYSVGESVSSAVSFTQVKKICCESIS